jgi:PAS domain S-box-containing protein
MVEITGMATDRTPPSNVPPHESPSFSDADFLRALLDRIPAAVFGKEVDDDFRFVYWNRFAEEYWGLKAEDILGRRDADLFPPEQADFFRKKDLETVAANRPIWIEEEEIHIPKGKMFLRTSKICVQDRKTGKRFLVGLAEDITEQRRLSHELAEGRLNAMNSKKMVALGEMAASIAHEINTPLSVFTLTIERIRRTFLSGEGNSTVLNDGLDALLKTADRIAKVIRALRVYSRHSENDPPEANELRAVIQDAFALCEERARVEGVTLYVDEESVRGKWIQVRPTQLVQVLLNLIGNAIDALSGQPNAQVDLSAKPQAGMIEIHIRDNGPGIPENIRGRLTEPFFTTKPPGKGTGLGLSIAKQLLEANGGTLEIRPSAQGAHFVCRLPRTNHQRD